jgi:hypothetical protein
MAALYKIQFQAIPTAEKQVRITDDITISFGYFFSNIYLRLSSRMHGVGYLNAFQFRITVFGHHFYCIIKFNSDIIAYCFLI